MKGLKIFFVMMIASLAACSTDDSGIIEPQEVIAPETNPAAIIGRWDEVGGDEWFIFTKDDERESGAFVHYNGQTESGTFLFTESDNTIHCKIDGRDESKYNFRISVSFDNTDKNLATFTMGSHTINVKRTQQ